VSGDVGVKGALSAIESSAELSQRSWRKIDGVPSNFYQWGERNGLHLLSPPLLHGLRKQPDFDTLATRQGAIWWPPLVSTGEVPIIVGLSRKHDEELSIRLGLFQPDDDEPKAVGMRFETPHRDCDVHEFHHAQLWAHIRKGDQGSRIVDPDEWIPEKQPSFPLQAKNALELVWAAAVTVYGKRDATLPFEADTSKKGKLTEYVRGISQ
jgi:hypothetical protein